MFVGVDWASRAHELCVVDDHGAVVECFGFAHSEQGLHDALTRLARLAPPGQLPVAIERPSGLLVERLLAAGHPVVPIHPNAFAAARPRWEGAASKSDTGDAYRLADYLRTDRQRLRRLEPLDRQTRELQALVRLRDDQLAARVAATNQLAALLDEHWPGAKAIFGRLDSEIALTFCERYPTPDSAARLGEARLAAFLRRHSYCGRRSPSELLTRLRTTRRSSPSSCTHSCASSAHCSVHSPTSNAPSQQRSRHTPKRTCSDRCPASAPLASAKSWPKSDH